MKPTYLHIKTTIAKKLNPKTEGGITYAILRDPESMQVYFILIANDGGGYFSRELVPFAKIQQCVAGLKPEQHVPAKTFKGAFVGKSVNNACFLLAALRDQRLLQPAPDASQQHILCGDWDAWKASMLAEPGEPFELPDMKKPQATASAITHDAEAGKVGDQEKRKKPRKPSGGKRENPTIVEGEPADAHAT